MYFGTRNNASVFGVKRSGSQHDQGPSRQRHTELDAIYARILISSFSTETSVFHYTTHRGLCAFESALFTVFPVQDIFYKFTSEFSEVAVTLLFVVYCI